MNREFEEKVTFNSILAGFISSYLERDKNMEFTDWLESKFCQEMPDMSKEESRKLADEIMEAVAEYDKALNKLNNAIKNGQTKEEWFAERMTDPNTEISYEVMGEKLHQMKDGITASNMRLMQEIGSTQTIMSAADDTSPEEWNKYNIKNIAHEIGEQVALNGVIVAANALKNKMQGDNTNDLSGIVKEAFQDGLIKNPAEAKAAVAGAVKVAAEMGLGNILADDIPTEAICEMAGVAVEGAEALFDVANGENTMSEALEKIGRAGVAAACCYGRDMLKCYLLELPMGPLMVELLGGDYFTLRDPCISLNRPILIF